MMKIKGNIRGMVYASAIAAIYVVLTLVSAAAGLSGGVIQFRLSEALTVLPVFTGAAVPGLFIGCAIANLVTGALPWDVAIGSLATLIGAYLTYRFRNRPKLAPDSAIRAQIRIRLSRKLLVLFSDGNSGRGRVLRTAWLFAVPGAQQEGNI